MKIHTYGMRRAARMAARNSGQQAVRLLIRAEYSLLFGIVPDDATMALSSPGACMSMDSPSFLAAATSLSYSNSVRVVWKAAMISDALNIAKPSEIQ